MVQVEDMLVSPGSEVQEVDGIFLEREPGTYEGIVKKILKGKVRDFVNINRIRNPQAREKWAAMADRTAYKIIVDVEGEEVEDILIESRSPKSRFARVLSCYQGKIVKGMKVVVEYDGRYWRISCGD